MRPHVEWGKSFFTFYHAQKKGLVALCIFREMLGSHSISSSIYPLATYMGVYKKEPHCSSYITFQVLMYLFKKIEEKLSNRWNLLCNNDLPEWWKTNVKFIGFGGTLAAIFTPVYPDDFHVGGKLVNQLLRDKGNSALIESKFVTKVCHK